MQSNAVASHHLTGYQDSVPNQERLLIPLPFPEGKEASRRLEDWGDDTTGTNSSFLEASRGPNIVLE